MSQIYCCNYGQLSSRNQRAIWLIKGTERLIFLFKTNNHCLETKDPIAAIKAAPNAAWEWQNINMDLYRDSAIKEQF